ncbi:hypothetical protein PsorP6_002682 [Peronosclerospora sorghi]|uniref:Uncharacterized protein n=1 Tax=Peronosclerospora sorghi TaxID=230839 RepID=A0ACC0WVN3_9STRA|nr:hypothetical protein PsorP6_002682 [Peronosclerospora sorghi]
MHSRTPGEECHELTAVTSSTVEEPVGASEEAVGILQKAIEGTSECLLVEGNAEADESADGCSHLEEYGSVEEGVNSISEEDDFRRPVQGRRTSAIDKIRTR